MSIENFKQAIKKGGARPNLFKVQVSYPSDYVSQITGSDDIQMYEYLIKGAQLPSSQLGQIVVPFRGRQVKIPGDRVYEPVNLTVINDTGFLIRRHFERWNDLINSYVDNTAATNDWLDLLGTVTIQQMGRDGNPINGSVQGGTDGGEYILDECWPSNISAIDLSFDSGDAIEEFTITLEYQHFRNSALTGNSST